VLRVRDGLDPETAEWAASVCGGHVGQARRLAGDPEARARREQVLDVPLRVRGLGDVFVVPQLASETAEIRVGLEGPKTGQFKIAAEIFDTAGAPVTSVDEAVAGDAERLRDLAGGREMRYPQELRPLDMPHDRQAEGPEPLPKCRLQIVSCEHVGDVDHPGAGDRRSGGGFSFTQRSLISGSARSLRTPRQCLRITPAKMRGAGSSSTARCVSNTSS
jgi:hypothetical protein